jgi:hypothetical protein
MAGLHHTPVTDRFKHQSMIIFPAMKRTAPARSALKTILTVWGCPGLA